MQSPLDQPAVAQPGAVAGIALPDERGISQQASELVYGADAFELGGKAEPFGTAASLLGSAGQPAFALYRLRPQAVQAGSIGVLLDSRFTSGAYVGLADYGTGRWKMYGPRSSRLDIQVYPANYSPAGNLWLVVLVTPAGRALINALGVQGTQMPPNAPPQPQYALSTSGKYSPVQIELDAGPSTDPDGQIIEYAWDWEGDGTYDEIGSSPQATHSFATAGYHAFRLRVTDDKLAQAETPLQYVEVLDAPATAIALASPATLTGLAPFSITLEGSKSIGSGGSAIELFEWDMDGDGTFEVQAVEPYMRPTHTFNAPGSHVLALRVTDEHGVQDTATVDVTCLPAAGISAIADPASYAYRPALAAVAGHPAIAYNVGTALYYVRASDANGTAWGAPAGVAVTPGYSIRVLGLFELGGRPVIGYLQISDAQPTTFLLGFTSAADGLGAGWNIPSTVDIGADRLDSFASFAADAAHAGFAYYETRERDLRYIGTLDSTGSTWNTPVTIDRQGDTGQLPCLAFINGAPAAAYSSKTYYEGGLRYARAQDALGMGWAQPVTIENAVGFSGVYEADLAEIGGVPAIAYSTGYAGLKFARALDPEGAAWGDRQAVDGADLMGVRLPELTSLAGRPVIAGHTLFPGNYLCCLEALDANGSDWKPCLAISSGAEESFSLAVAAGQPAVATTSIATGLKFLSGF